MLRNVGFYFSLCLLHFFSLSKRLAGKLQISWNFTKFKALIKGRDLGDLFNLSEAVSPLKVMLQGPK